MNIKKTNRQTVMPVFGKCFVKPTVMSTSVKGPFNRRICENGFFINEKVNSNYARPFFQNKANWYPIKGTV